MLLQRASAGSGKTFKLAKTYIRLFISRREQGSDRYILLPTKALRDNHAHILGVTFTNKATNEMKERIVAKLAALAQPHPAPGREPHDWKAPDYLLDFTGERPGSDALDDIIYNPDGSPVSRTDVSRTCQSALRALLNDYGRFNISTIDTFFQSVLRTFAYELRLNDNYHVELNDDYLAQVGLDHTLSLVNDRPGSAEEENTASYVASWAKQTVGEFLSRGENWNMFNKASSSDVYSSLYSLARKMNMESFKLQAATLDEYFSDMERFRRFLPACIEASHIVPRLFAAMKKARSALFEAVAQGVGDPENAFNGMAGAFGYLATLKPFSSVAVKKLGVKLAKVYADKDPAELDVPADFLKKNHPLRGDARVMELFAAFGRAIYIWQRERDYRTAILSRLHYLGMLHYVRKSSEAFRVENNIIPLSATNDILHRIINHEHTPFIYERIGGRLNHYLLDEFQDTSLMQWENLRPLLEQSTDEGDECLVIGDAKQSIYRFRNAEPDIITNRVSRAIPTTRILPHPQAPSHVQAAVNTNWRSASHIVRANNTLFSLLPRSIDSPKNPFLTPLYEGVVQQVHKKKVPGYVDLHLAFPLGYRPGEDPDELAKKPYACLGALIDSIRERGYRLSDIAILVDRNKEGSEAIAALMDHNKRLAPHGHIPIEILSEESLKVGDSAAVKVILAVLRQIARGFRHDEGKEEGKLRTQVKTHELAQFVANFHCYLAEHSSEQIDSILRRKLDDMLPPDRIEQMLAGMQATTLPALVEAIAANFTTALGGEQAAYIAAFQDAVLEYCENYPADIASFLAWWDDNADKCSIAAPEGIDAVRVMTIHKSKGLEFDVVIVPNAIWTLEPAASDAERELIWVSHEPDGLRGVLPGDVPQTYPITPALSMADEQSPFHEAFEQFRRHFTTDQLNKTYVAFTRAVRELHVYAPVHKTKVATPSIGDELNAACDLIASISNPDPALLLTAAETCFESGRLMRVGSPTTPIRPEEPAGQQADSTGNPIDADVILISDYARPGLPPLMRICPEMRE